MFFIVSELCLLDVSCRQFALQKELTHTILLHPSYFGPRMLQFLESKLYADVEGTCSGAFGYIIAVVSILDIGKGMVISGSGQAEFITRYRAIVFKPFKGEVVDGVVNNVNKVCRSTTVPCIPSS
jgi:DNA-directed RNA polymerase II subunit RPB7